MNRRSLATMGYVLLFSYSAMVYASDNEGELDSQLCKVSSPDAQSDRHDSTIPKETGLMHLPKVIHLHLCSFFSSPENFGHMAIVSRYWNALISENVKGCAFLFGHPGAGKSTLAHLMAGRKLYPIKKRGYRLEAELRIPAFNICHSVSTGTFHPSFFFDVANKEIIFDCPAHHGISEGLGSGYRVNDRDVENAIEIFRLLNWKQVRILLLMPIWVLEDGERYAKYFNLMAAMFPKQAELTSLIHVVIVGAKSQYYGEEEAIFLLKGIIEEGQRDLSERAFNLIQFLVKNPDRVAHFHNPDHLGSFVPRRDLVNLINNRKYVLNLQVTPPNEDNVRKGGW